LNDLAMFALMCAGVVTGVYVFVGAFKASNAIPGTNALWSGIAGLCVTLVSIQKAWAMFSVVFRKKKGQIQLEESEESDLRK